MSMGMGMSMSLSLSLSMGNGNSNNNDDNILPCRDLNKNALKLFAGLDGTNNGNGHLHCHKLDQKASKHVLHKLIVNGQNPKRQRGKHRPHVETQNQQITASR